MKIKELNEFKINNQYGKLLANWKSDLEDEEHKGYIPKGYSKTVLELSIVKAKELGKGYGEKLMNEFLNSSIAKSAELIFLDPNPNIGLFDKSGISEIDQIEKLKRFYSKFGFRNNPKSNRMWRVQIGTIATKDLPV